MIPDDESTRLEQIAQELVCRVRDDQPDANGRWLLANTTEADRYHLLFVLAIAVDERRTWRELTAWARGEEHLVDTPALQGRRRQVLSRALDPRPRHPNRRRQAGAV